MTTSLPSEVPIKDPVFKTLLSLVRELGPFIDPAGRTFCYLPSATAAERTLWPLGDQRVAAVVKYRSCSSHGSVPESKLLASAISVMEGELWTTHSPGLPDPHAEFVKLMADIARTKGDWEGTLVTLRKLLVATGKQEAIEHWKDPECKSSDALGRLLARIILPLRRHGIELYRRRTALTRLWGWHVTIVPSDASDACMTLNAGKVHSDKHVDTNALASDDTDDASVIADITKTLGELLNG